MKQGSCINDVKVKGKKTSKTGKVSSFLTHFPQLMEYRKQIIVGEEQ